MTNTHPAARSTLRKIAAIAAVAVGVFMVGVPTVAASAPPPVEVTTTDESTHVIAALLVTVIETLVIPHNNRELSTASTPSGVKAIGTIILNAAWALIANGLLADGSSAFSSGTLYTAVLGCAISILSYIGLYRPLNVTSTPQVQADGTTLPGRLATVGRS